MDRSVGIDDLQNIMYEKLVLLQKVSSYCWLFLNELRSSQTARVKVTFEAPVK